MKILVLVLMLLFNFVGMVSASQPAAQSEKVVVFTINDTIDDGSLATVKKAYQTAEQEHAKLIIMQMDTFGGAVDAATKIRDIILDSDIPTVCLVKNRAWSAGALIALAHNNIAMTKSASIGAAEPIPATEKTISALKAEFASTAEKTGRNARMAEAMVDKTLGYKSYAKPGQILSLTQDAAHKEGIVNLSAQDVDGIIKELDIKNPQKVTVEKTFKETLLGWLGNPAVKSILITVIMLGIITEIKTAGTGIAGLVAVIAGVGVFGVGLISDSGAYLPILIFLLGVGLLVLELFIPGFGISGILGILFIVASFFLTLGGGVAAIKWIALSLVMTTLGIYVLSKYLPNSSIYNRIVLKSSSTLSIQQTHHKDILLGQIGITITMMRPAGKVKIGDITYDALTEGDFLQPHTQIIVSKVVGEKIYISKYVS